MAAREIITDAFQRLLETIPELTERVYLYGDDDVLNLEDTHAIIGAEQTAVTEVAGTDRTLEENASRILVEVHHFETTGRNWSSVVADVAAKVRDVAVRLEDEIPIESIKFEGDRGIDPYGADSRGVFVATQLRFVVTYQTTRGDSSVLRVGNF